MKLVETIAAFKPKMYLNLNVKTECISSENSLLGHSGRKTVTKNNAIVCAKQTSVN